MFPSVQEELLLINFTYLFLVALFKGKHMNVSPIWCQQIFKNPAVFQGELSLTFISQARTQDASAHAHLPKFLLSPPLFRAKYIAVIMEVDVAHILPEACRRIHIKY